MGWAGRGSLETSGARHDRVRTCLRTLLLAVFCLVLAPSVETPAQNVPWNIETVQHRLVELGYDVGGVDGLLGPKTRAALRSFQADRGLAVTGLPDGDTQRALFAAQASRSERPAPPPADDPPSLEAVPLGPVEVAPLAPMVSVTPHEGLPVAPVPAEPAGKALLAAEPDRGSRASQGDWLSELGSWETGLIWAAVALGVLGAVSLIAVAILRLAGRKSGLAERSKPTALPPAARSTRPATSSKTSRGAHVFGVDVPPSGESRSG